MTKRATSGQPRKERGKSADVAAARARVVELAVLGWAPERIATDMGRTLRWVKRARDEMKLEIARAAEERVEGVVLGATEAKRLLGDATVEAANMAINVLRSPGESETAIKASRARLAAAALILDRGGVPAKAELDVEGTVLESIHATLEHARKGAR